MFRPFTFIGVASAAIIESRPHEHLQVANAQLQNATDAVIKTAAVAGLAYAGAYMAGLEAGMTTSGSSYDSSRKSQESSTGARYCNTKERNPLNYRCTAEYFNGKSTPGPDQTGGAAGTAVAIRNYWCCPAPDLGSAFQGDLDGTCVSANTGASGYAQIISTGAGRATDNTAPTSCVYQGPCSRNSAGTGSCESANTGALGSTLTDGIFGGTVAGGNVQNAAQVAAQDQITDGDDIATDNAVETQLVTLNDAIGRSGATFGPAVAGATVTTHCCVKQDVAGTGLSNDALIAIQTTMTSAVAAGGDTVLSLHPSFCQESDTCPAGFEDANDTR